MYNVSGTLGGLTGSPGALKWKYYDTAKAPPRSNDGRWSDQRQYCSEQLDWTEETWTDTEDGFQAFSKGFYDNAYEIIVRDGPQNDQLSWVPPQMR